MRNLTKGIVLTMIAGALTTAASAGLKDHVAERFKALDGNRDGVVTHEEMMAEVHKKFGEFDKNRDGFLELSELPEQMPVPEKVAKRMEKRMEKMAKRHPEAAEEMKERMEDRFNRRRTRINFIAKLDRDGDEKVSVEEFVSRKIKRFKKVDGNGDGSVTLAEAEEAASKMAHRKHRKSKKRNR